MNSSNKLAIGSFISIPLFLKVEEDEDGIVHGTTNQGTKVAIKKAHMPASTSTSGCFEGTVYRSLTDIVEIFTNLHENELFTVKFTKKDGSERVLRGRRISTNNLGRSEVFDLEENGLRQVDHRTIQYLICKNKKYIINH